MKQLNEVFDWNKDEGNRLIEYSVQDRLDLMFLASNFIEAMNETFLRNEDDEQWNE